MAALHTVQVTMIKHKFAYLALVILVGALSLLAITRRSANENSSVASYETQMIAPTQNALLSSNRGGTSGSKTCPGVTDEQTNEQTKSILFNGTCFRYRSSLATDIRTETVAASPLEVESDKPDSVAPEHSLFTFVGPYALSHESSFFSPQIRVYTISDYRNALSKSTLYSQQLDDDIISLKAILAARPNLSAHEIPFLPFGIDATQVFRAHIKYVDFKNGKGIIFLTQYNVEPSLINNQGLVYTFQGVTDDGLYYVSATFPINASILPEKWDSKSSDGYRLPSYFYGENYESNRQQYEKYLTHVTSQLNELTSDKFEPRLDLFDELTSSLCISGR